MSAWGWSAIPKPTFRKVILATIAVSTIVNLIFFNKYYSTIRKEQMREAVLFVINSSKKADPVYGRLAWFFNYYFRQYKSPTVVVNPTEDHPDFRSLDFNTELAEKKGVWVLQVHLVSALTPVQQEYLDQHYVVDQKADFFYAYAYHYRRKEDTGKPD
jgi:hypothetical protein